MNGEDVTLSMPCYNTEDTLPAALNALTRLDPGPSRILCVDDGSTDGTKAVIEAYETVELIEHEENRGIAGTMNTALSHTETPLFAKVDADVVVPPDWLERILEAYDESGAAFVQGRFVERKATVADRWREKYPAPSFRYSPKRNKAINGATILAETDALREIGGYDEQYRRAFDDIDVVERLVEAGYEVYYSPSVRSTHIRRDTWWEVLHTEWAYHNDPETRGKPDDLLDVIRRIPYHSLMSARCLRRDVLDREFERLGISILRLPYMIAWDIDHVLSTRSS